MGLKSDRIVVVTGASRGAGKGIALALGAMGATVYVTARSQKEDESALPGTVFATADEITRRGGKGIAVVCDHADDMQVKAMFEKVDREQGRLDILVNNATCVPDGLVDEGPFWEQPLEIIDILDVGMRSHYTASYYAAPLLIKNGEGLIVMTSSFGGCCYMHGPAYGSGKAATDKMAHDMSIDFKQNNISVISLWMGLLLTERTQAVFDAEPEKYGEMAATAETSEFSGLLIDALALDKNYMDKSGRVLIGAELAEEYGVTDINGKHPPSHRPFLGDPPTYNEAIVQ